MRDYARITPGFWIGETGKRLRGHHEAQIVALYLMSSPYANMLGLFYQPIPMISHETGLTLQGASKGLARCIEVGFCAYDEEAEVVWVYEMARFQIGTEMKDKDKRITGVQNEYDKLPNNKYLGEFFERYSKAYSMTRIRGLQGASKPHRSQEQAQAQDHAQDQDIELPNGNSPSDKPKVDADVDPVPKTTSKRRRKVDVNTAPISDFAKERGDRWWKIQHDLFPLNTITAEDQALGCQKLLDAGYYEDEILDVLEFIYNHNIGQEFRWVKQIRTLKKLTERPKAGSAGEGHAMMMDYFISIAPKIRRKAG